MHDEPHGRALLEVARQALLDEVAPGLAGRPRFVALMVANAIGIVMREMETEGAREAAWARALETVADDGGDRAGRLARAIRAGAHDAEPGLYAALVETAEIAAQTWKPDKSTR